MVIGSSPELQKPSCVSRTVGVSLDRKRGGALSNARQPIYVDKSAGRDVPGCAPVWRSWPRESELAFLLRPHRPFRAVRPSTGCPNHDVNDHGRLPNMRARRRATPQGLGFSQILGKIV